MRILAVGDICAAAGRRLVRTCLSKARDRLEADLVIVQGENANDNGRGISPDTAMDFFYAGADIITLGNHAFNDRRIYDFLDENDTVARPFNAPPRSPGTGYSVLDLGKSRVCVCSLAGRVEMDFRYSDPFKAADRVFKECRADIYIFDFHAEATSEKKALGFYLDGRASVVYGTHTHVPTRDICILPKGTGYITDIGMSGGSLSVLGVKPEKSIAMFLGEPYVRYDYSEKDPVMQCALFDLDEKGMCLSARALDIFPGPSGEIIIK